MEWRESQTTVTLDDEYVNYKERRNDVAIKEIPPTFAIYLSPFYGLQKMNINEIGNAFSYIGLNSC